MKNIFNRVLGGVAALSLALSFAGPIPVFAATTPTLGAAATYGVLSSTYTNTVAGTTINGDVGFTTPPAVVPGGVHTNYGSGAPYATAGTDQGTALTALASQPCTYTFPVGAVDLATDTTHGPIGVYTPGVYCTGPASAASIGAGGITLSGSGTYIFRIDGALTTVANSVVTLSGASACDVFWTPTSATTLGATSTFAGTVIDNSGITIGSTVTWSGRALSFGGTVSTTSDTISVPSCTVAPAPGGTPKFGTINVVKLVINDNGGTKTVADFPLFVNGTPVVSGETNTFPTTGGIYHVSESNMANYTQTYSGDCDVNGDMNLNPGNNKFCILTNNDIGAPVVVPPVPPIIDVVKVPSPLALPAGPGSVTYTYTVRNIGTVPMTNVTLVGDICSPLTRVSGDVNNNNVLEVSETWKYTCTTNLTQTTTNTVTATGWANGISSSDVASATVVVGSPLVPPLIHVTKVPNPLALRAGGGNVTYTEKITNPGTVALSNVNLTDDKCGPMKFISGDTNGDSKLDLTETWTYTCTRNLTATTTNTAVATGEANGYVVRDIAVATVIVANAVPALPNTGLPPQDNTMNIVALAAIFLISSISLVMVFRKRAN